MSIPVAVIIGDIHFTVPTLDLAVSALSQARDKAIRLGIPLVLNGDTLDTKAIIRGECANALISVLAGTDRFQVYINTGNHDMISAKGKESSLNFLRPHANVINHPVYIDRLDSWIIPYFDSGEELTGVLSSIESGSRLILHQGVMGADMGHYIRDTSSLSKDVYSDFRVIASHYHKRQDIKTGRPRKGAIGLFSYVGNPYTQSFGEANDPEKGFQILNSDGTLEFVSTNLRKHVIIEKTAKDLEPLYVHESGLKGFKDLYWIKLSGNRDELATISKKRLGEHLFGHTDFKLDLIPTDENIELDSIENKDQSESMDSVIEASTSSQEQVKRLKALWREVLEDT